MFACKLWGLRATDIMQGVVFGTRIDDMAEDDRLLTRLDFDQAFGTAVNRFCCQAVIGHPLTPFGLGHQKRGFLPLRDSMQCLTLALENPPGTGEYRVFNQFQEVYDITNWRSRSRRWPSSWTWTGRCEHRTPHLELEEHYYSPDPEAVRSGLHALRRGGRATDHAGRPGQVPSPHRSEARRVDSGRSVGRPTRRPASWTRSWIARRCESRPCGSSARVPPLSSRRRAEACRDAPPPLSGRPEERNPDGALVSGDPVGPPGNPDRADNLSGGCVDTGDGACPAVADPDCALADAHIRRGVPNGDPRDAPGDGIDPRHGIAPRRRDPDAARTAGHAVPNALEGNRADHPPQVGRVLKTASPWMLGTQTAPSPTTTPSAELGRAMTAVVRRLAGSSLTSVRRAESTIHSAPAPTATPPRRPPLPSARPARRAGPPRVEAVEHIGDRGPHRAFSDSEVVGAHRCRSREGDARRGDGSVPTASAPRSRCLPGCQSPRRSRGPFRPPCRLVLRAPLGAAPGWWWR